MSNLVKLPIPVVHQNFIMRDVLSILQVDSFVHGHNPHGGSAADGVPAGDDAAVAVLFVDDDVADKVAHFFGFFKGFA